jgi:hypothetical protein
MSSPAEVKALADKHGVQLEILRSASGWDIDCWSPNGLRFKCSGTHFLALPGDGYYTRPDWAETKRALADAIAYGFEECDDPDCDVCEK